MPQQRRKCNFHHCFHEEKSNKSSMAKNTFTTNTIQAQSNYDWVVSSPDMPQQRRKCNFRHRFHEEKSSKSAMEKTHAWPTQFTLRITMTELSHHWTCHWSRRICFHHCFHTRETSKTSTARNTRTTNTIRAQSNYDWIISSLDMPLKPKDMLSSLLSYTRNKQDLNSQKHAHHRHNSSSE